jgi:general secretion pathway protein A
MNNKILSTYGLTRLPFGKDIPASELLDTELASRARTFEGGLGRATSAVVTGDSGSDKTCLLRSLEEDLSHGRYRIHYVHNYVHNATVNRRDFYRQLCIGLGLEPRATFAALFACVSQHIQDLASQQKLRVVLLIDEAHMLPLSVLDQMHI